MHRLNKMNAAALSFLVAVFLLSAADAQNCSSTGSVRLVWGAGPWEGNLQICLNDLWGWVCHNSFSNADAMVACRQLGYSTGGAVARSSSYYGWGNGTVWIDYVGCTGSETTINNCPYSTSLTSSCTGTTIAGVVCQSGGACNNHDVRLISVSASYRSYGRVEFCYNNQWGTVCDDGWDYYDAITVCKQLGFDGTTGGSSCCAGYGQGYVPIGIRNVGCSSSSSSLSSCTFTADSSGCSHSEDAGAYCYGRATGTCTNGEVKLWRPYNNTGPTNEGVALVCRSGVWKNVCGYSFSCYNAKLMCKAMGYPGALGTRSSSYYYGRYHDSYYDIYSYYCYSYHTSLSQCSYSASSYCCSYSWWYGCRRYCYRCTASTEIGLVCYSPSQANNCIDGAVRLVNGTSSNEGRAEYCYEGDWVPFCGMSSATASLICNQLGYNYTYGSVFDDERFGRSNKLSSFSHKYCGSEHLALSQCIEARKESSCYILNSRCTTEYGVRCYNPGLCTTDGQLRLANGTIQQEGRVEICLNGVWGGICETSWGSPDATVFCRGLGYNGPGPSVYYDSYFGETYGPIIWSYLGCSGFETGIQSCNKNVQPNFNCTQRNGAGVLCKDQCQNGDIQLIGGKYSNEGTVLVCYNNLWGLISDTAWSMGDARVVCNSLGHSDGIATPITGSYYGKPNLMVHFRHVSCFGQEMDITHCSKTVLSLNNGKLALSTDEVAGVDCIYDEPSECIKTPDWVNNQGSECNPNGNVRVQGSQQPGTGRLEYCYNGYWSPFCNLDPVAASVACRQLGFTSYTAASIIPTVDYGVVRNFSLFKNITCTGLESSLSQCTPHTSECTPWCPHTNIAIRCFNPGMCTNGETRLVNGIIENEGRLEICYNGVWGAVCDQGWDKTDAHVVCTQLGHSEREPVSYSNSSFGAGYYPIVYSNFACGGWETDLADCSRQVYPQSNCSRNHVAGVLCGYDCDDGDVRIVGGEWDYEGTVEVCYDHIWGLVSDSGWSVQDAEVVCRQLGYQTQGTIPYYNSHFGKPNKTIHLTNMYCTGQESQIDDCTKTSLSLQEGKSVVNQTNAAGVRCYTPDWCIIPPTGGVTCTHGEVRLTGGRPTAAEGNLEYCYYGTWSLFCNLGPQEALVACKQLGYVQYDITAVFDDGRFGGSVILSLFQNFSCTDNPAATSLGDCDLIDKCQSKCLYPMGIRCYESTSYCDDGSVRLVNGSSTEAGRLEVCNNNIWGSVCGDGFGATDAYVVCRQIGLGESEPTVFTNSYFGDGNEAFVYSNFGCEGYEENVGQCSKESYGSFSCSRSNAVGIICRDNCSSSDIRLVGGPSQYEGAVQVCYYNTWGLVSSNGWSDREALVVCHQLSYNVTKAFAVNGSAYATASRTVQLTNVFCNESQQLLNLCDKQLLTPSEGAAITGQIEVAGVSCVPTVTVTSTPDAPTNVGSSTGIASSNTAFYAVIAIVCILLIVAIVIIIGLTVYTLKQKQIASKFAIQHSDVRMSSIQQEDRGVQNPLSDQYDLEGVDDEYLIKR